MSSITPNRELKHIGNDSGLVQMWTVKGWTVAELDLLYYAMEKETGNHFIITSSYDQHSISAASVSN